MGYSSAVVGVLALVALSTASIGDNSLDNAEPVALVSPPSDTSIRFIDRPRQIPILVLLGPGNLPEYFRQPEEKSSEENPQPTQVQKPAEGKDQPATLLEILHRDKRHSRKKGYYGGGGGCSRCQPRPVCNTCGGGGGGGSYSYATASASAGSWGKK